jgi:hypothetical protein
MMNCFHCQISFHFIQLSSSSFHFLDYYSIVSIPISMYSLPFHLFSFIFHSNLHVFSPFYLISFIFHFHISIFQKCLLLTSCSCFISLIFQPTLSFFHCTDFSCPFSILKTSQCFHSHFFPGNSLYPVLFISQFNTNLNI